MPNWVKNIVNITGPQDITTKALEYIRDRDTGRENEIDFNNVIPMPKRLSIVSGGYDRKYVALYLKTLSEEDKERLRNELESREVIFYHNYFNKYKESFTNDYVKETDLNWMEKHYKEDYYYADPSSMEDVGKAYIDNILEYGSDTWYDWCCENWGTKWNACESMIMDEGFEFETAWSAPFPIIHKISNEFPELTFYHEWADENLGCNCGRIEVKAGELIAEETFDCFQDAHDFACLVWGYDPDEFNEDDEEG